jgi:hypothetical protein
MSNVRASGWARDFWFQDSNGTWQHEMDIDGVNYSHSSRVRCADCHEIRRDVHIPHGTLEPEPVRREPRRAHRARAV